MKLDNRQRAMLREIGVRVWQPAVPEPVLKSLDSTATTAAAVAFTPAPTRVDVAINSIAAGAINTSARGTFRAQPIPVQTPVQPRTETRSDSSTVSWSAGQALALYAQATLAPGPRWLVLAETPAAAVPPQTTGIGTLFNPFDGEAGKLLDNMLRAVNLHKSGSVSLAPLVRQMGQATALPSDFHAALARLVQTEQPDVVLVMGRLAVQAVLQSSEPFGKLRGQLYSLHGSPAIVMQDAGYLLRSPLEKARAWEDLCLALSVLQVAM